MRVRGPDLPDERAASSATVEKLGDEARRTAVPFLGCSA